jgi:hypothetical protein
MSRTHSLPAGLVLALCLFLPPSGSGQGSPADPDIRAVKESTYAGKWKLGELLSRYCEKQAWSHDAKEEVVVFRGRLKKGGQELVVHFRVVSQPVGDGKNGKSRLLVLSPHATLGGKKISDWQARVFEKEYLETGSTKIAAAKASPFYTWKTGDLLAKYCDRPAWTFNKGKDAVEFRGRLKKGGDELKVSFQVAYGPLDRSNTRDGWAVLDSEATRAGKALGFGSTWRALVFIEEDRLMRQGKDEK